MTLGVAVLRSTASWQCVWARTHAERCAPDVLPSLTAAHAIRAEGVTVGRAKGPLRTASGICGTYGLENRDGLPKASHHTKQNPGWEGA